MVQINMLCFKDFLIDIVKDLLNRTSQNFIDKVSESTVKCSS